MSRVVAFLWSFRVRHVFGAGPLGWFRRAIGHAGTRIYHHCMEPTPYDIRLILHPPLRQVEAVLQQAIAIIKGALSY